MVGEIIGECDTFDYLGLPDQQLIQRWEVEFQKLSQQSINLKAADKVKLRLFRFAVENILFYGMESVPLSQTTSANLDGAHRRILRSALGIKWPDVISTDNLMARLKSADTTSASISIRQRRIRLVGHTLRARNPSPLAEIFLSTDARDLRRGQGRTLLLKSDIENIEKSELSRRQGDSYRNYN